MFKLSVNCQSDSSLLSLIVSVRADKLYIATKTCTFVIQQACLRSVGTKVHTTWIYYYIAPERRLVKTYRVLYTNYVNTDHAVP